MKVDFQVSGFLICMSQIFHIMPHSYIDLYLGIKQNTAPSLGLFFRIALPVFNSRVFFIPCSLEQYASEVFNNN